MKINKWIMNEVTMLKIKLRLLAAIVILTATVISHRVEASTVAYLTWTAPTLNEDGSALDDLAGYKVYYGTSSVSEGTCPLGYTEIDTESANTTYTITGLTEGTTYYFQVTAYDTSGNESDCSTEAGSPNEVSKQVSYRGDINPTKDCTVDNLDYTVLHTYYNTSNNQADINKDGIVDSLDYSFIHADYNNSFGSCNQ